MRKAIISTAILLSCGLCLGASAQQADMTFFITSVGSGKGGDLGGLAGADAHCQALAQAAGAGNKAWRAYLSTNGRGGANAVNARDRIGNGPWQNAKGAVIATSVADLHSDNTKIGKANALDEKGQPIKVRGDTPNMHDILTPGLLRLMHDKQDNLVKEKTVLYQTLVMEMIWMLWKERNQWTFNQT